MEPAQATQLKINYAIYTFVVNVWEDKTRVHLTGVGNEATFEERSDGWYVHFEGSYEALHFGMTRPQFNKGDKIKITFEKVE